MSQPEIIERLDFAVEIARQAGKFTLQHYRSTSLAVERKGDGSPVTEADKGAEKLLRSMIAERFPDDGIVGEEFGETPGSTSFQWILDPIDGTKSFVSGVPLYTTLVAVMRDNEPLLGVIFAPAADEMVYACLGQGCWHVIKDGKPQPALVSDVDSLDKAIFLTTCTRAFTVERQVDSRNVFDTLAGACRLVRTWGDAFGYMLVATGRADVMVDPAMNLWDAAALLPIIQEAGGRFTDWRGRPTVHSGEAVATNAALAEQVRKLMDQHADG